MCTAPEQSRTPLHDLPHEIFQPILDLLVATLTLREGCRLREVHSIWALQIERIYIQRRSEFFKIEPFVYEKDRRCLAELYRTICNRLSSPRSHLQGWSFLRSAVAQLMQTSELVFSDISNDCAVESNGYPEDHTTEASRRRFNRIVEKVASTFVYSEGREEAITLVTGRGRGMEWYWRTHDPLEWACATAVYMEDLTAAKILLAAYADFKPYEGEGLEMYVSGDDSDGEFIGLKRYCFVNSLCLAVRTGNGEMAGLVLQNKAAVNEDKRNETHDTPLKLACQQGSLELVELLLDPRWDPKDATDIHYLVAITFAARCCCRRRGEAVECETRIAIIKKLIGTPTPIDNLQTWIQKTLVEACTWGCATIAGMLLDMGADINGKPKTYWERRITSALTYAASHGHVELLEYLLKRGARHVAIFFQANAVTFVEEAANPEMMGWLSEMDAPILVNGPLDMSKADFTLRTAVAKGYVRTVRFLARASPDSPVIRSSLEMVLSVGLSIL